MSLSSHSSFLVASADKLKVLKELYVRPEYQRKGLGSRLVQWGIEKADELGLPGYVEGTDKGTGLYLKFGFEEVARNSVDLVPWGGKEGQVHTFTCLYREPKRI